MPAIDKLIGMFISTLLLSGLFCFLVSGFLWLIRLATN